MKAAGGSVLAAVVASACCLGPVVLAAVGAGALGAMATRLGPFRPVFLGITAVLLTFAFYDAYRPSSYNACAADGACRPASKRRARFVVWIAAVLVGLLVAFPYYAEFLP